MNPFDWAGPPFLAFYAVLIAVAAAALFTAIAALEDGPAPALPLGDPYQIAWLRGGDREAVLVAVLSLLDRNLVALNGLVVTARASNVSKVMQPIEQAILRRCTGGGELLGRLSADPTVASVCDRFRTALTRLGLVPDGTQRRMRFWLFAIAVAVLAAVALGKLALAYDRGRGNVGFLIALALLAPFAIGVLVVRRRRTRLGDRILADLRRLFAGLRGRAHAIRRGEATNDAMLLAAVFGIAALPDGAYFELRQASGKANQSIGGSCGSSGGSSCGGGGGGGCGGCGGS